MDTSLTVSVSWAYLWEAVQKGQEKEACQMLHEAQCYLGRLTGSDAQIPHSPTPAAATAAGGCPGA